MNVSHLPPLSTLYSSSYLSFIICVYLLIPMGSSSRNHTSVSHIVTFEMELECYGKMEILIFVPFPLNSVMEMELYSISI